ncbi:MAG: 5-formyltetrahydrofolate cyclo-ligase [Myxococcota bacterium]|nr:5-formyltetrahydrofolate cyclo-ligase [Myxococcota bacterium]
MKSKHEARSKFRKARRTLDPNTKASNETRIADLLFAWIDQTFEDGDLVALYSSMPNTGEVQTSLIHERLSGKYPMCYPKVLGRTMAFHRVHHLEDLTPGFKGVPEPVIADAVSLSRISLIVVPGVAFTAAGTRLGQGGGHYDRLLGSLGLNALTIGLAHNVQITDQLPTEASDKTVDGIISENGWVKKPNRDQPSLAASA